MSSSSNRAPIAAASSFNEFEGSERNGPSFEKMKTFESRLSQIERKAPSILSSFYEPHLRSFSVRPGTAERLSVTSTCYALQAMYATNDSRSLFEDVANFNVDSSSLLADGDNNNNINSNNKAAKKIPVKSILEALILTDWRSEDMFQVPLLLYTILMIDKDRQLLHSNDERLSHKVKQLISAVLSSRPLRRRGARQYYSDYILFQVALATSNLQTTTQQQQQQQQDQPSATIGNLPLASLPPDASYELSLCLTRSTENSFNELCRQLAYRTSGDRASFDVIRLAYSLLTYITSTTALAGTAGRTEPSSSSSDNNNEPKESAVPPINHRLVASALDAFFSEQNANGLWDKGQPIYESFRKVGRNVGNAFVFSVDTVGSLLDVLPHESFRAHLGSLKRLLEWIEGNEMVEILPDYCDPFSGQCYGKPLQGWSSPHLSPGSGVMAWSTAQTLTCVSRLRKVIARLIHDDVLLEFGGTKQLEPGTPNPSSWNRLLDTDLETSSSQRSSSDRNNQRTTLKDVLMTRVLQPFVSSSSSASYGAAYSTILFGPPGTAKTTICEAVAEYMGWDFLVIDTSAFLADGLTNVAARIRYVFERLQALERCVILFDEIEEFCLDRETRGIGMESRMLTTAMLTCINNLRREKKSIFFLATNRLRAFDSAITRPGRFDMQLFVGTPNLEAKCIQFRDKLDLLTVGTNVKEEAIGKYRDFLAKHYEDDVMFMNYLEGLQLAQACANIVAKGMELDDDAMSEILKPMAAVMTVRGPARDEYTATMELSRL